MCCTTEHLPQSRTLSRRAAYFQSSHGCPKIDQVLYTGVHRYWKNNPEEVATPRKKKPTPRVSIEAIDDFDRGVVCRAIYGMYDRNEHVTMDTLLDVLRANPGPDTTSGETTHKEWRKDEYTAWLTKHDIKFDPSAMKMELMSKALAYKL
uniref:Uncharacterized protein n=1 Tax=Timema genevievae TaxID=629358 RepID=A0A7R9PP73_TIMGE|nr:unnamed protein product [Timema genevievae]